MLITKAMFVDFFRAHLERYVHKCIVFLGGGEIPVCVQVYVCE